MPVVFRHRGFRFFFFSNEGDPREPIHIHVRQGTNTAKFWVEPVVELVDSYGFSAKELNILSKLVEQKVDLIVERWNDHFGN